MADSLEVKFTAAKRQAVIDLAREYYRRLREESAQYSFTISTTLRISEKPYEVKGGYRMRISSPYFWAGILDQGRGPVHARERMLIWFRDPEDDPRLIDGYPKTVAEARGRRLTQAEYEFGLMMNRIAYANKDQPFMLVRPSSAGFPGFQFTVKAAEVLNAKQRRRLVKPILDYAAALFRKIFPKRRIKI